MLYMQTQMEVSETFCRIILSTHREKKRGESSLSAMLPEQSGLGCHQRSCFLLSFSCWSPEWSLIPFWLQFLGHSCPQNCVNSYQYFDRNKPEDLKHEPTTKVKIYIKLFHAYWEWEKKIQQISSRHQAFIIQKLYFLKM